MFGKLDNFFVIFDAGGSVLPLCVNYIKQQKLFRKCFKFVSVFLKVCFTFFEEKTLHWLPCFPLQMNSIA